MIAEFGIIPDVFDRASYSSTELGDVCLRQLLEYCRDEALVRDFCGGAWSAHIKQESARWHIRTKEFIETLCKENRLRLAKQIQQRLPENDAEWYYEAAASELDLIVARNPKAIGGEDDPCVTPITGIEGSRWGRKRSPSVLLQRRTADYLKSLRPVLKHATSFMFIDPYIDETKGGYREFSQLLCKLGRLTPPPRLEIHVWQGDGQSSRSVLDRFHNSHKALAKARMGAKVFVWPVNFHDRFLITDLVGLSLSNGFDIATNNVNEAIWTRLGRNDREVIEKRFEPNAARYGDVSSSRFNIGASAT